MSVEETQVAASSSPRRRMPEPGDAIGRYEVVRRLGTGSMGYVVAARDRELDRMVAIKLLHTGERDEGQERARMRREARALAMLAAPNVVRVFDVGEHDGNTYLAMELVEGTTLRQWLAAAPRSWREVLDVFVAAGEGLAAAHAIGLVHRDFKPDNVLIGSDGRVRVGDFGLARPAASLGDEPKAPANLAGVAIEVTTAGELVGTPAYMAPEQLTGAVPDPRADQFAFCVALYEGLYGRRPFSARSLPELVDAVVAGRIEPAPRGSGVPGRLRAALVRGLSVEAAARFGDMKALLDALRRSSRRRIGPAIAGLAVGAAVLAALALPAEREGCDARAWIAGHWNDARRETARAGVLGTEAAFAAQAWDGAAPRLDAYAQALADARARACEGKEHADFDRHMSCLDARATALDAVVDTLAAADAGVAQRAIALVDSLEDPTRCEHADDRPLERTIAPEVFALREQLAQVAAALHSGQATLAIELATVALADADALGDVELRTEAALALGRARQAAGDWAGAEAILQHAFFTARGAHLDRRAAEAAIELVRVDTHLARFDDAEAWIEYASALRGESPELELALARQVGQLHAARREYADALAQFERALELATADRSASLTIAALLGAIGTVHERTGDLDRAEEAQAQAVAMTESLLGSDHPELARAVGNAANVRHLRGDYAGAAADFARACAIFERALGPEHPDVGRCEGNLGETLAKTRRFAEALPHVERSYTIAVRAHGEEHPIAADALARLGFLHHQMDDPRAEEELARALAIEEALWGKDHEKVARLRVDRAVSRRANGDVAGAIADYRDARAVLERALGPSHPALGTLANNLGNALEEAGDLDAAERELRAALALRTEAHGEAHDQTVHSHMNLGLLLVRRGALDEARRHLDAALEGIVRLHGPDHAETANAHVARALADVAARDWPAALAHAEQALASHGKVDPRPIERAEACAIAAKALLATRGDRRRALELARTAREAYVELGGHAAELTELDAILRGRWRP